jgi:hypothetical protein
MSVHDFLTLVATAALIVLAASHEADAFRCLASRYKQLEAPPEKARPQEPPAILHCGPGGKVVYSEGFSILEWANKRAKRRAAEA